MMFRLAKRHWQRFRFTRAINQILARAGRSSIKIQTAWHDAPPYRSPVIVLARQDTHVELQIPRDMTRLTFAYRCAAMAVIMSHCAPSHYQVSANVSDGVHPNSGELAFCSNTDKPLLVPDVAFVNSNGYAHFRTLAANRKTLWVERSDQLVWRGATTGQGEITAARMSSDNPALILRTRACLLLKHLPECDGQFSKIAQSQQPELDRNRLAAEGLMGDYIEPATWLDHKFVLIVDGNTNSWHGLFTRLLFGCCVLKVASPGNFRQWYYDRLEPWVNFVPVRADLTDLAERLDWCRSHHAECEAIAIAGRSLAESLTLESQLQAAADKIERLIATKGG